MVDALPLQTKEPMAPPEKTKGTEKPVPKVHKTTLREQGALLPLGLADAGGMIRRDISARRWNFKVEKELGALAKEKPDANLHQYVGMVLSVALTKLGPFNFEPMPSAERLAAISRMYVPDIFYAYVWLRTRITSETLAVELRCPFCNHVFDFVADLNSVEVKTADSMEVAKTEYVLRETFDVRGAPLSGLIFGPALWGAWEKNNIVGIMDVAEIKAEVILISIHGLKDRPPAALVVDELDEMDKIDIELSTKHINENALGPDMSIDSHCKRCAQKFRQAINWGYHSFFGASSL